MLVAQSTSCINEEDHRKHIGERIVFSTATAGSVGGDESSGISYFERIMLKKNRREIRADIEGEVRDKRDVEEISKGIRELGCGSYSNMNDSSSISNDHLFIQKSNENKYDKLETSKHEENTYIGFYIIDKHCINIV